jgi:tetrahydromethanopterin S-methyltransferase subunit F
VSTALINMIIGIAIGSLLSAVLVRTVLVNAAQLRQ